MDTNKETNQVELDRAIAAAQTDKKNRRQYSRETWHQISVAAKKHSLKTVCKAIHINPCYAAKRLNDLQLKGDNEKSITGNPTPGKVRPMEESFACLDLSAILGSEKQDFKVQLKFGRRDVIIEGHSKTFDWERLFRSLGNMAC